MAGGGTGRSCRVGGGGRAGITVTDRHRGRGGLDFAIAGRPMV